MINVTKCFIHLNARVYDSSIPRYTINTNGISINNDCVRPSRPRNRRYTNNTRRITSLSDDYTRDVHSISLCSNEYTDVIPNITTLSQRYTSVPRHRTPPRTLIDAFMLRVLMILSNLLRRISHLHN